jgi:hypothetical protein
MMRQPDHKTLGGDVTTRPYVADDFAAIRARMEELRGERAEVAVDDVDQTPSGSRLYDHRKAKQEHSQLAASKNRPFSAEGSERLSGLAIG